MSLSIHKHSSEALVFETPRLAPRAQKILSWLIRHGPATDRQVVVGMGFPDMNCVRPRITALKQLGLVREIKPTRDIVTGRTVRTVAATATALQRTF